MRTLTSILCLLLGGCAVDGLESPSDDPSRADDKADGLDGLIQAHVFELHDGASRDPFWLRLPDRGFSEVDLHVWVEDGRNRDASVFAAGQVVAILELFDMNTCRTCADDVPASRIELKAGQLQTYHLRLNLNTSSRLEAVRGNGQVDWAYLQAREVEW